MIVVAVNMGTAVGYLDLDTSKFQKGFKDAESSVSGFSQKSGKINSVLSGIGSAVKKTAVVVGTGVTSAATAIGTLAKKATDSYATYEQMTGGIETLFGAQGMSLKEYASSVGKTVNECKGQYEMLQRAQSTAMKNAGEAYKTAGLSANEYMATVTSFAASLKQSTKNEEEAAKSANQAVIDMADNANKMGTNMQDIQNAYQGFAKQNYTMLDNLKLGYGGTKEEMQRLLADAEKISGVKYDMSNLNDVYSAIHVVQTELGITGTTAKEASTTIEGSANAMKSAWENLLTGMGDKDADMNQLVKNFVDSAGTYVDNLIPVFTQAISSIGQVIEQLAPILAQELPKVIENLLPSLISAAGTLVAGLVAQLPSILQVLFSSITEAIDTIGAQISEKIPALSFIFDNLSSVLEGLVAGFVAFKAAMTIGTIIQTVVNGIKALSVATKGMSIAQAALNAVMNANPIMLIASLLAVLVTAFITAYKTSDKFRNAVNTAFSAVKSFVGNVVKALVKFFTEDIPNGFKSAINAVKQFPSKVVSFMKNLPANVGKIIGTVLGTIVKWASNMVSKGKEAGSKFVSSVISFLKSLPSKVTSFLAKVIAKAVSFAKSFPEKAKKAASDFAKMLIDGIKGLPKKMLGIGKNIIDGIVNGIKKAWNAAKKAVSDFAGGIVDAFKSSLGIHSPSKVMKEKVGVQIANGVIAGVKSRKGEMKKTAAEISKDIVDAAEKKLDVLETYNKISVQQEVSYWKKILDSTKKGTEAHLQAYKNYKQARQNIDATILSNAQKYVDKMQTYNKMSNAQEYAYWKSTVKNLKKGSDEYLTAYKSMISAKKAYNQELKDIESEYNEKVKDVYSNLKQQVNDLTSAYNNQVEARKQSLLSTFKLFDEYEVKTDKSGSNLLDALGSQVEALARFNTEMESLEKRNILPKSLVKELRNMGVDATGELMALNEMTDAQLRQYASLWNTRNDLVQQEADRENKDAYDKLQKDIDKANKTAADKLDKLSTKYNDKLMKMKDEAYDSAKVVGKKTVSGIVDGIKSKQSGLKNTLQDMVDTINSYMNKVNKKVGNVYSDYRKVSTVGSHRAGLTYVPYDGYRAMLHEGERVLTKGEAKQYNDTTTTANEQVGDIVIPVYIGNEMLDTLVVNAIDRNKFRSGGK